MLDEEGGLPSPACGGCAREGVDLAKSPSTRDSNRSLLRPVSARLLSDLETTGLLSSPFSTSWPLLGVLEQKKKIIKSTFRIRMVPGDLDFLYLYLIHPKQ